MKDLSYSSRTRSGDNLDEMIYELEDMRVYDLVEPSAPLIRPLEDDFDMDLEMNGQFRLELFELENLPKKNKKIRKLKRKKSESVH